MSEKEVEVFRLCQFEKNKYYAFALKTRTERWKGSTFEKHYTTNPLQYLGKHTHSETWGESGDGRGGAENFDDNERKTRIVYDYDGKTCFLEVPYKMSA